MDISVNGDTAAAVVRLHDLRTRVFKVLKLLVQLLGFVSWF